jgi:hypothetical protein
MPQENNRRRIVLSEESHGDTLQSIFVASSGKPEHKQFEYAEARSQVDESKFYHDPSYGWFLS